MLDGQGFSFAIIVGLRVIKLVKVFISCQLFHSRIGHPITECGRAKYLFDIQFETSHSGVGWHAYRTIPEWVVPNWILI